MRKILAFYLILILCYNNSNAQVVSVDEPKVCYQCHGDSEELLQKKHVHTAFETGVCSECHNPHASKHALLLNNDVKVLCFKCHENFKGTDNTTFVHQPVNKGECVTCHNPHASDNNNLLNMKPIELCTSCHTEISSWLKRTVIHEPVAGGDCNACHDPHASKNEKLVNDKVPALCFNCHDLDAAFKTAHKGDDLAKANCITCHDPHASNKKSLIMENQHKPFADGNCKACHKAVNGVMTFELNNTPKKLCSKCHSSISKQDKLTYHHILDDELSCLNCHNPHASSSELLLISEQQDLCTNCHFNNNPDKTKEQLITHKELVCSTCHSPHGSDNNKYLPLNNVELCKGCHEGAHKVSHPIGEDVIDPRNNEPMTCLTCHQLHGADFEKYLPLDPKMDLCIQCHKK